MENSFQIDVITPIKNINVGTSEYLRAPNLEGLFGIKARHVSSIISVGEGEKKYGNPISHKARPDSAEQLLLKMLKALFRSKS